MKRTLQVLFAIVLIYSVQTKPRDLPRLTDFPKTKRSFVAWPVNTPLSLKCKADGATPIKVRWLKNGKTLGNTRRVTQDENWNLKIRKPKLTDNGVYTCIVSNEFGVAKHSYSLRILRRVDSAPVLIPGYPKPITARVGDSVALECLEKRSNQISDYRWLKSQTLPSNDALENNSDGSVIMMDPAKYQPFTKTIGTKKLDGVKLSLKYVSESDEGYYTCFLSNNFGATYGTAYLKVKAISPTDPPEFIIPKDRRQRVFFGTEGKDVTLSCLVRGGAPLTFRWFFKGQPLTSDERHIINNGEMIVKNAVDSDMGVYTCLIENAYGQIKHHFKLHIQRRQQFPPVLLAGYPKDKTATIGSTVLLHCSETGPRDLLVDYRWLKWHGQRTSFVERDLLNTSLYSLMSPHYYHVSTELSKLSKTEGISLKLENLTLDDQGLYTCFVSNPLGHTYNSGYLTVVDPVENEIKYPMARLVAKTQSKTVLCHEYEGTLAKDTRPAGQCNTTTLCGRIYDGTADYWQTFCDREELCKQNGVGAGGCVKVTIKARKMELCCCKDKLCNTPVIKLFKKEKETSSTTSRNSSQLTTFIFLIILLLTIVLMLAMLIYRVQRRRTALHASVVHSTRKGRDSTKKMIMETKWLKEDR